MAEHCLILEKVSNLAYVCTFDELNRTKILALHQ